MSRDHLGTRILILVLVGLLLVGFVITSILAEITPDLDSYSRSPQDLVIAADENTAPGGPLPGQACNHIPNLRIWGDGRTVYTAYQPTGERTVYTGRLDPEQIADALELLKNRGFFEPVTPETPNPAGTFFELRVNLAPNQQDSTIRSDKTYFTELVNAFDLSQFTVFTPAQALLVTSGYRTRDLNLREWPGSFGFSLAEADQGKWIQGPALDFLWQFVNTWRGTVPALSENGKAYVIDLEIPGISKFDPPFDCWGSLKSILTPTPGQ